MCRLGDPPNCVNTRLRFACRANQKGGRRKLIYATGIRTERCRSHVRINLIKPGWRIARRANAAAAHFKLTCTTALRTEMCSPGDPVKRIRTRLRGARRANQEADHLKLAYATGLRTAFCPPGDPATRMKNAVARCTPSGMFSSCKLHQHVFARCAPSESRSSAFKLVYVAGFRTEICAPGDPANFIQTRFRVARRANQEA